MCEKGEVEDRVDTVQDGRLALWIQHIKADDQPFVSENNNKTAV